MSGLLTLCVPFTVFLALGLLICNIVFSFCYKNYEFDNETIILYINEILNSKFIYEFNPRNKCQEGEEKLVLGTWDGTIDKCKCGSEIKDNACESGKLDCETIEGEKPKNYTIFGGKEICIKRKGETYYNLIKSGKIISKNQNCPENEKSCGIVDTLERKLCINKDEVCPLNITSIDKKYEETYLKKYISKINLDNDNIMNFLNERKDENKIISIIKLSDGLPCLNVSEKNWKSYHRDEKYKTQECNAINGKKLDEKYQKFENFYTKKVDLYRDNGLSEYITPLLEEENNTINLYGTYFIGLDVGEDGFDFDKVLSIQDLSNSCGSAMKVISIIIIGAVALPLFALGGAATATGGSCDSLECFVAVFSSIIAIAVVLGFLADIILSIIIFVSITRVENALKDSLIIGDDYIKILINELIEKYSGNYSFALALIILLAILVGFGLLTLFLYCKENYYF